MQRQNGPGAGRKAAVEESSFTERAADVLHEGVDALKERIEPREERLREAAEGAGDKLRNAGDQYGEFADQAREYVRMHPLTSAAVAFAAGVVLVSFLRRR
jgi:ElaB/YqjD/DUF883 family membrane-anchored ribosome-binding protein